MKVSSSNLFDIQTYPLEQPSAVICMADSYEQLANIMDGDKVLARLNLIFNDATQAFGGVCPPQLEDAQRILDFALQYENVVAQCQMGCGRSHAVVAALRKIQGEDNYEVRAHGTYNRRLYNLLLMAANVPLEPQPLISVVTRIKYAPDRFQLLYLSMQRQRHKNWELIAVTDGPNAELLRLVEQLQDPRVSVIVTPKALGRWGHPYRQRGIDAARGEFIGLTNDDNYYVPGYLEQMLLALQHHRADVVLCPMLHSYLGWTVVDAGMDVGSWLATAAVVKATPWTGQEWYSDGQYVETLCQVTGRVVKLDRPLFVHN